MALITELIRSGDGEIRAAKIRVVNSAGKKVTELRRPVQHLVPLEVPTGPKSTNTDPPNADQTVHDVNDIPPLLPSVEPSVSEDSARRRPKRTAAVVGELLRRDVS